jgi:histidinol phosphatase-like PHP family hydrolase
MIDLHTHCLFSDGELIPAELIRRAAAFGYEAIAITDHADASNYDFIIPRIVNVCTRMNRHRAIIAIPGIEITHVPPDDIAPLADEARALGAAIVIVHGETIVEPVAPGTNASALDAAIDILAHPGLITDDDVRRAVAKGICLEITARSGHALANGHVARLALKYGARLVLNTDTHAPRDLITCETARQIAVGAGLTAEAFDAMLAASRDIVKKRFNQRQ